MDEFLELLRMKLTHAEMDELPANEILEMALSNAIGEINRRRNHVYTEEAPVAVGYERFVVPLATAALLKTGAEGQDSHSENGISRSYITDGEYPRDILRQITWMVR